MNGKSQTAEQTTTFSLTRSQQAKIAFTVMVALTMALLMAIYLASPVMTAFGMSSLAG